MKFKGRGSNTLLATDESVLLAAAQLGASLPTWDRSVVARCHVNVSVVQGGPAASHLRESWDPACQMVLTNSTLMLLTSTRVQAFDVTTVRLATKSEFLAVLIGGDDWYICHAYSEADLQLVVRLLEVTAAVTRNREQAVT